MEISTLIKERRLPFMRGPSQTYGSRTPQQEPLLKGLLENPTLKEKIYPKRGLNLKGSGSKEWEKM